MKRTATTLLGCLLIASCSRSPTLEGNTAGQANYYVQWITTGGTPNTCFVSEGRTKVIEDQSPADQVVSFRFDAVQFRVEGSSLVISAVGGGHLEKIPMSDSIFLLSKGRYTKIKQSETIRNLMKQDHGDMGEALIGHLKATGKL